MVWRNSALRVQHTDQGNPQESSRAVTDTDEDMVRILTTDDSQMKWNVVRQLEAWSSIALTSFLWMKPRTL